MFTVALALTLGSLAIPPIRQTADDVRAAGAARYVSARLHRARMEAVIRSADVALRFTATSGGYEFAVYVDGNRNGVFARDIQSGIDARLSPVERLGDNFVGVEFGALPGLPPVDSGGTAPGTNPIRLGSSGSASFSALGTSSTGSLYIRGAGSRQYAIRIYGETGKCRILKFDPRSRTWNPA